MVVSIVGSIVATAGSAVSDAGQRIDPNGALGASCKAIGDTVEAFGCKARDALKDLEADCIQGIGMCVKAATFGAMGAGIVAASVAHRAAKGDGVPDLGEPELTADNKAGLQSLQAALGVEECEVGQEVRAQNVQAVDYCGPDRRAKEGFDRAEFAAFEERRGIKKPESEEA